MITNVKIVQKLALLFENKVLSLRRSSTDPGRPLTWDLVGGGVDEKDASFGVDFLRQALAREVKEEIGITVDYKNFIPLDIRSGFDSKGTMLVWLTYFCKIQNPIEIELSFEHDQFSWVSKEEFMNLDFGYAKDDFLSAAAKLEL